MPGPNTPISELLKQETIRPVLKRSPTTYFFYDYSNPRPSRPVAQQPHIAPIAVKRSPIELFSNDSSNPTPPRPSTPFSAQHDISPVQCKDFMLYLYLMPIGPRSTLADILANTHTQVSLGNVEGAKKTLALLRKACIDANAKDRAILPRVK